MVGKWKAGLLATAMAAGTFVGVSTAAVSLVTAAPAAAAQAPLNLGNEQGLLWPCSFNPFNPSDAPYSVGVTYETLDFIDALNNAKVTPWLASAYAWSDGNKTLTFTIRSGVKFTDGKPLTAADVAYTFNLIKANKGLDVNAVWTVLSSVTQKGANQVVFQFKSPAVPYFYYIAGQTPIVPEHIWSKIANPLTDPVSNPVGSGGYVMNKCTPQNIQWTANPHYWQAGPGPGQDRQHAGLPVQQHVQRVPGPGQGRVGQPVHPQHPGHLRRQEGGQPLLVPARGQRVALPEPDQGAAQRRQGA